MRTAVVSWSGSGGSGGSRGLWQAFSTVAARLRPGTGVADLLTAVLPGGSVTGAPKRAATALAAALEPVGRGPAMGALGTLTAGRLELGLTIRTVVADDRRLHGWAGGGSPGAATRRPRSRGAREGRAGARRDRGR